MTTIAERVAKATEDLKNVPRAVAPGTKGSTVSHVNLRVDKTVAASIELAGAVDALGHEVDAHQMQTAERFVQVGNGLDEIKKKIERIEQAVSQLPKGKKQADAGEILKALNANLERIKNLEGNDKALEQLRTDVDSMLETIDALKAEQSRIERVADSASSEAQNAKKTAEEARNAAADAHNRADAAHVLADSVAGKANALEARLDKPFPVSVKATTKDDWVDNTLAGLACAFTTMVIFWVVFWFNGVSFFSENARLVFWTFTYGFFVFGWLYRAGSVKFSGAGIIPKPVDAPAQSDTPSNGNVGNSPDTTPADDTRQLTLKDEIEAQAAGNDNQSNNTGAGTANAA